MKNLIILITLVFATLSFAQSIDVRDNNNHILIQINDEGDEGGSILFPDALTVDITNNKLYNIGGELYWYGELIGSCDCDITRIEFDDLLLDFEDLDSRITALENE